MAVDEVLVQAAVPLMMLTLPVTATVSKLLAHHQFAFDHTARTAMQCCSTDH